MTVRKQSFTMSFTSSEDCFCHLSLTLLWRNDLPQVSSVTPLCFLLVTALCTLPCEVWMSVSSALYLHVHMKKTDVGIPAETWNGVLFKCGPDVNWCLLCIDTLRLSCSLSVSCFPQKWIHCAPKKFAQYLCSNL